VEPPQNKTQSEHVLNEPQSVPEVIHEGGQTPREGVAGDDAVPAVIGCCRILRPLGSGGEGRVYLAHDSLLQRWVAIKFLGRGPSNEVDRLRVLHEARAIAQLQHPHVITIHQVGEINGEPYLVTEFVRGENLRQIVKPVPWPRLLEIALGLARGLAAAHRNGILHRDVKSSNVMLTSDGGVKLIDFGLAKLAPLQGGGERRDELAAAAEGAPAGEAAPAAMSSPRLQTLEGAILGTPIYMAPEVFRGEPASYRSDVYSLGVVLYELAVGATPAEELQLPLDGPPSRVPSVGERVPRLEPAFVAVVDRCLASDPAERFESAVEALEALERIGRRRALRRTLYGGAALAIVLAIGFSSLLAKLRADREIASARAKAQAYLDKSRDLEARAEAARREALSLFDQKGDCKSRERAEEHWSQARALTEQAEAERVRARDSLAVALSHAPEREELQMQYGEILFARILAAESWGQMAQARELTTTLEFFDPQRSWRRRLDAPARFEIDVVPREAEVIVERYQDERGSLRLEPVGRWGGLPRRRELPAGSYLLRFTAPGGAPVRLPIVLGRGEERSVALTLPLATQVPAGYVYVPPGRFLFGAIGDDDVRTEWFGAPPEHAVETDGYLISATEVTYGDWIEYLSALPPEQRRRHRLHVGDFGQLRVGLDELPGGDWRFHLETPQGRFSARRGERIHYSTRGRRAEQDWLRFPASGISLTEAREYVAWLDRSGRLPGARLCSEREWERAARGADGRSFPHGNRLQPDDANFDETYARQGYGPDEAGSHPASASPFGVHDLAGNVWEWVESVRDPNEAVVRGGSWWEKRRDSRSVNREVAQKDDRDALFGLRVCASLSIAGHDRLSSSAGRHP
jgi:formylglycine-generating enzyme required for sulfatase activity